MIVELTDIEMAYIEALLIGGIATLNEKMERHTVWKDEAQTKPLYGDLANEYENLLKKLREAR